MAKLIIDIPDDEYNYFMHSEDFDSDDGLDAIEYICNGIVLDNVTNGDVIKALYQKTIVKESKDLIITSVDITTCFSTEWWNAPYKVESEGQDDES